MAVPLASRFPAEDRMPDRLNARAGGRGDEGIQYAAEGYRQRLGQSGVTSSMSRRGDCLDNAPMESFFHTLKTKRVHHRVYTRISRSIRSRSFSWRRRAFSPGRTVRRAPEPARPRGEAHVVADHGRGEPAGNGGGCETTPFHRTHEALRGV